MLMCEKKNSESDVRKSSIRALVNTEQFNLYNKPQTFTIVRNVSTSRNLSTSSCRSFASVLPNKVTGALSAPVFHEVPSETETIEGIFACVLWHFQGMSYSLRAQGL